MSLRRIDAYCPDCKKSHPVEVEVTEPPPREIIRLVPQDDSARVNELTHEVTESQQALEALRGDLHRWQSGENHLTAQNMLDMLLTCPNCRPTLETFVKEQERLAIARLSPEQVKELGRAQKWWPPPPIELSLPLSRKARL